MKKIFTHAAKSILTVLVLIGPQAKAWAVEATVTTTTNKITNIFTQPWIWIAIIVVSVMILIGPFDHKEEYPVIMKKKTTGKRGTHL